MKNKEEAEVIKGANVAINKEPFRTIQGHDIFQFFPHNKIEASSIANELYVSQNVIVVGSNQFLAMLEIAFNNHKPVTISPDAIWLLICQSFAEHIKLYPDIIKREFNIDKKLSINVDCPNFVKGEDNPWEEVFPQFTEGINEVMGEDLYSNLVLNFTTSTKKEIAAFEIAFLDTLSNHFTYSMTTVCGIPEIKLTGTSEDYNKILIVLEALKKYDLAWWIDNIIPHVAKIKKAIEGEEDRKFWTSIFKRNNMSGDNYITGWICDFFPYVTQYLREKGGVISYNEKGFSKEDVVRTINVDSNHEGYNEHEVKVRNPRLFNNKIPKLELSDFPLGKSIVNFKWQYYGQELDMNFVAGFIGIKENKEDNFLSAEINWIIEENNCLAIREKHR